jgi:tripartite-type tricarboxylate transporter receptor subunit TctC
VIKLNAEVRSAMADPDVAEKLTAEGIEWQDFDPDQFTAFFRSEIARWSPIAKKIAALRQKEQGK